MQVVRLLYTNNGFGLLALGSNGIQRLWKWSKSERNPSGMVSLFYWLCSFGRFLGPKDGQEDIYSFLGFSSSQCEL